MSEDLKDPTADDYLLAVSTLSEDDLTKAGAPKVEPLNAALNGAGFRSINAEERDAFRDATEPQTVDPDPATFRIRLEASMSDPLPLYIHGVGQFSLRVGEEYTLPADAISALENAGGVTFTTIKDTADDDE